MTRRPELERPASRRLRAGGSAAVRLARLLLVVGLSLAGLALAGCAPRITAQHTVPPAFPIVLGGPLVVVGETTPYDRVAAEALAGGLVAAGLPVRHALAADAAAGERVMLLRVGFESRWERQWTTRPETVCGPFGCQVRQASVLIDVPVLVAELHATVRGADGSALAGHTVREQVSRTDASDLRAQMVRQLVLRLARDLSPRRFPVRFRWPRTRLPAIDQLASLAEDGRFEALVPALREALRAHGDALGDARRARAQIALAWALRLSARTAEAPVERLDEALACLDEATRLEPSLDASSLRSELEHERALYAGLTAGVSSGASSMPVAPAYR